MKAENLKHIFYSGYNASPEWEILDELSFLIKNGALFYGEKKIYLKKSYHDLVDRIKITEGMGPQEKGHMALKKIAQQFLAKQGLESGAERSFLGAHPDILAKDFSWAIECGTTTPASVLLFLQDEKIRNVGILPYPYENEDRLTLHIFSRGKNFDQHVIAKKVKLRAVFEKFHQKKFKKQ